VKVLNPQIIYKGLMGILPVHKGSIGCTFRYHNTSYITRDFAGRLDQSSCLFMSGQRLAEIERVLVHCHSSAISNRLVIHNQASTNKIL